MGSLGGRVAAVLSPVVFPSAVFVPSAVFRVSRVVAVVVVVAAGRAVVAVFSVDGLFRAGSVVGSVLPVFSVPAVVPRRVGERGGGVEVGRVGSKRDG